MASPIVTNGHTLPILSPRSQTVKPHSIYEASTVAEIRASLAVLHSRNAHVTSQLQTLLDSQAELSRELGRLDLLRAHLGTQVSSTRSISHGMLEGAASTASSISAKVKALDLEKQRVEATLSVVEQVVELKACVQGVVGSMGAPQDWEAAAGYIARAERIPEDIVNGTFAANTVPSVEVPDAPSVTLENAKQSLCGLFLREFEKAAEASDGARVTRFFKLFPLIGRGDTGLDVYGRYVCQGVASTARKNLKEGTGGVGRKEGFFYANALTKLFEHIAQVVEGHGGLVEQHYGEQKMVRVIERLQVEADIQGGIILDTWGDERTVDRRLVDVKSYPFSFLVQSFLPAQRNVMNTPRTGSPGIEGRSNGRMSEDEGVDMKEVDGLLSEIAVMLGRWSLYCRFLAGKCKDPDANPDRDTLTTPDFLMKSALHKKVAGRLITPFNIMSTFFFRRSVEKAFQLDETPQNLSLNPNEHIDVNPPYIISPVDDVMYIVDTVLKRSLSTSQQTVVASVVPTIARVLGSDFVGMIQRKMRDESYPKAAVQGGLPTEEKIIAFIVLINSLDVSSDYIVRIIRSQLGASSASSTSSDPIKNIFPFNHDSTFVTNALHTLQSSFMSKSSELISDGLHVLFNNVVKPRLRPVLSDTFRDIEYSLSSTDLEELAASNDIDASEKEFMELVPRRFEHAWDALMKPIARIMTPKTFSTLLEQTAKYLARVLEKRVWSFAGKTNAIGGVRMERDFNQIVNVICRGAIGDNKSGQQASSASANYALKEGFQRVSQILMVLNMEDEEWDEMLELGEEEGGVEWVLSEEERVKAKGIVKL